MFDPIDSDQPQGQPPPFDDSRRKFLSDVGKVGGAAVMYNLMEVMGLFRASQARAEDTFSPLAAGGASGDVIVVGAGIAGLTAAYELLKGGYSVLILEPRKRPGGRNWTARGGTRETEIGGAPQTCEFSKGQYMNCGPARLPQGHITIDYCRELGVALEVFTNANADGYYFNENTATTTYGPLASTPVRHRMAKADYYGYVSELLAKCTNQGALDGTLSNDDRELLLAFLRSFGAISSPSYAYTGGSRRGYEVVPAAGDQAGTPFGPPPTISELLQSRLGLNFSFEFGWDQAMLMFQPVGGMDQIPYAFERAIRKLGGRFIYDAEVTAISNTGSGVEVVYGRGKNGIKAVTGDVCVCTIPPMVLKSIPSNFSPEVKTALEVPTGAATGKVGLEYGRRFWEEDERILGGITNTNLNIGTIWYPSYGYLTDRGVVIGSYNFGGSADFFASLTPQQRAQEAVLQGMKIHGAPYRDELVSAFSVAWRRIPYSEGGWVSWPGGRGAAYELLGEPDGNVYFAGDHLSHVTSWQAGAIHSARRSVQQIHERFSALASTRATSRFAAVG